MLPKTFKVVYFLVALAVVMLLSTTVAMMGCNPVVPTYEPSCAGACDNARRLCGPETLKPKNGTCEDVCVTTESGGGDFRTRCFASAATCDAVTECGK